MKTDAFGAYKMYLALRLHFTSNYNALKYNFKVNADYEKFRNKPDAYWFKRLAEKMELDDIKNAFVANFIAGKKWGGVHDQSFEETFVAWKKRTDALTYTFTDDIEKLYNILNESDVILADLFVIKGRPWVVTQYEKRNITLETLVILDTLTGFVIKCNCQDTIVWPNVKEKIEKYKPFIMSLIEPNRNLFTTNLLEKFPIGERSGKNLVEA